MCYVLCAMSCVTRATRYVAGATRYVTRATRYVTRATRYVTRATRYVTRATRYVTRATRYVTRATRYVAGAVRATRATRCVTRATRYVAGAVRATPCALCSLSAFTVVSRGLAYATWKYASLPPGNMLLCHLEICFFATRKYASLRPGNMLLCDPVIFVSIVDDSMTPCNDTIARAVDSCTARNLTAGRPLARPLACRHMQLYVEGYWDRQGHIRGVGANQGRSLLSSRVRYPSQHPLSRSIVVSFAGCDTRPNIPLLAL
jgi:hypothetical protein